MTLKLYNTLTRTKQEFRPLDPNDVRMYVCGPTVYDYAHIGNARPVIVFDVLFRLLRHLYGAEHVTYVRNITDIDDKINARAREEGVPIRDLTERTAKQFHDDIAALGVLPPTHEPRATDSVPEMIAIIEKLIARGVAYVADGHVLFSVPTMKDYGQLSKRPLDEMIAGARVDIAPYKRDPMDFVLWKPSDAETPGWDSPWGRGRPGWHIECSAMSWKYLGEVFDIHGGGIDLVFPHHENELAQTKCAFGHDIMANIWMHNGFLQVEGQKMSKSLGNFVTIRDVLSGWRGVEWPGEAIRFFMMMTHYTEPMDWTFEGLEEAHKNLWGLYDEIWKAQDAAPDHQVLDALCDDLNTAKVRARLFELRVEGRINELSSSLKLLGFSRDKNKLIRRVVMKVQPAQFIVSGGPVIMSHFRSDGSVLVDSESQRTIDQLIDARREARRAKNWSESDRIRDELAVMGVILKDNKDGTTTWQVKR